MISLLADRKGDWQAVLRRRQGTGRKRSIRAGRILQAVKIQHQFARLLEPVVREAGVKKAARGIRGRRARRIAQYKKQLGYRGVFQDGIKPVRFAEQRK